MKAKVAVIGDVMIDEYITGAATRLSSEAPVPILNIKKIEWRLGGAGNVVANVNSLLKDNLLIGGIGQNSQHMLDHAANAMIQLCKQLHIPFHPIYFDTYSSSEINEDPSKILISSIPSTIIKTRYIEDEFNNHLLRVDREQTDPQKRLKLTSENRKEIMDILNKNSLSHIIISDYDKGFIDKKLMDMIKEEYISSVPILVDGKPDNLQLFKGVYLIKPNFKEFKGMINKKDLQNTNESINKYGPILARKISANIVVTRGSKGASLITKDGEVHHVASEQSVQMADVSGAGDTFMATLAVALHFEKNLLEAIAWANKAASMVVQKSGTAIITPLELGNFN